MVRGYNLWVDSMEPISYYVSKIDSGEILAVDWQY